jgi:hypothetical protein
MGVRGLDSIWSGKSCVAGCCENVNEISKNEWRSWYTLRDYPDICLVGSEVNHETPQLG